MNPEEFIEQKYSELPSELEDISKLMTEYAEYHINNFITSLKDCKAKGWNIFDLEMCASLYILGQIQ